MKDVGVVSSCKVADKVSQLSVKVRKNRSITLCSQWMDGNRVALLPQASFPLSPFHFAHVLSFLRELIREYTADWLEPEFLPM